MDELIAWLNAEWQGIEPAWAIDRARFAAQTRAATELVLASAQPARGARVLDLASGTGEPALALAEAVGADGLVMASDAIAGPLQLLAAEAERRGLRQLRVCRAPMEALPFPAASFELATCRLGLMLCPAPERALAELRRVLRPGARVVFVVWSTPQQPLFEATLGVWQPAFASVDASRPGPFRFARAGMLSRALAAAGFSDVSEREADVPWAWPGPAEAFWEAFLALSGPSLRAEVRAASERCGRDLQREVVGTLRNYERQGSTDPRARLIVASARNVEL